jgi:hypothetical protein
MNNQTKESRLREILGSTGCLERERSGSKVEENNITEMGFTEAGDFGVAVIHHSLRDSIIGTNVDNFYLVAADLTPGLKIDYFSSAAVIETQCKSMKIKEITKEGDAIVIKYNNGVEEKNRKVKITIETVHSVQLI